MATVDKPRVTFQLPKPAAKPIVSHPFPVKEHHMATAPAAKTPATLSSDAVIFYSSAATLNIMDAKGARISFRNNFLRTSDPHVIEVVTKELVERKLPNVEVRKVSQKEFEELTSLPKHDIVDPNEGVIESLPKDKELPHQNQENFHTGMQGSTSKPNT